MAKLSSEKFNILLIILIFVIPLIALNSSYWFISKINFDLDEKEQENEALHEAETLAVEGNFETEFAIHFKEFFDDIQNTAKLKNSNESFFYNHIKQSAKRIFENPFPKYNLYVFKIPNKTEETELLYYEGSLSTGKKILCKAFECLYKTNIEKNYKTEEATEENTESEIKNKKNDKTNEIFAKSLLGKYTNISAIAHDMKGITTYTNGIHKTSWFIWDYADIKDKGIYGVILLCNELDNSEECGRLLALKSLKSRAKATGAFIPVYKDYGEVNYLAPLDKSDTFKKWANSLTIKNKEKLDRWIIESLPQKQKLGKYSAFCYLDRNSTHIAVVLVKSNKMFFFPKWLIIIDFIIIFSLLIILYSGLCFGYWPEFNLRTRFVLSYALASVVPLSLLFVIAYGYLLEFESTSEELANNDLQLSLNIFDSYKLTNIKEYKIAFNRTINNPKFLELIKEHGIHSTLVTDYIVKSIEKGDPNNPLPIFGAVIYDEVEKGAFSQGSVNTYRNVESFFDSFESVLIELLRDKMLKEDPNIKLKEYKRNEENDLVKKAYDSLNGTPLTYGLSKFSGLPLPRKNGDFCGYSIFNLIKIDNNTKYIIHVMWDDKTLDDRIIQKAFNNDTLKKLNQNFIAYRINGQEVKPIDKIITRHVSKELNDEIKKYVRQSTYLNKTDKYVYKDNIILVMPAFNFNQIVFVGWVNKIGIIADLFYRKLAFIILFLTSLLMLRICSLRSFSVFFKPITTLKKALDEVSFGNLNIGFKDNPDNELGKLSNEFDKMISDLREKERLSKLISDQAVEALKKSSSGLLNDTETFKGVALVSDIRNFTGMSEKYDPVIITELLNEHFAEMAKIISDNGGLIYKFIGDAIEAFFPEKEELKKSATERAFQAGCQIIIKLKEINKRRKNKDSFTYRIGVGLCYGTMYSGTVGSLETRLDYSIIGDPLKNAAIFEALTIQNPDFPFVIDENIAEKMADFGLKFKKIDSKNLDFNLFTLDESVNIKNSDFMFSSDKESFVNKDEDRNEDINYFSLSNKSSFGKKQKDLIFYSFLVLYISLLITIGIITLYKTTYSNLKSESDKYASRLCEHLKCDGVLKSSFEALCYEFYDDLNKMDFYKVNPENIKDKIEQIANKYEKLGVPIPRYCCCYRDENKIPENQRVIYKGFSSEVCNSFDYYTKEYWKYIKENSNKNYSRELNILTCDNAFEDIIASFTTKGTRFYNMQQGTFYRRSDTAKIGGEEILFDTERIFDESQNNLIAYIFCGMPENINKDILPNYYTLLSGKHLLMAIKNKKGWYFSLDFPEKEKELFQKVKNNTIIDDKRYYHESIDINDETFDVYIVSRDLFNNYYSYQKVIIISFVSSILILTIIFWLLEINSLFVNNSIATILRKDIFLSAIIPILTVCFVSYLYVEEESNIKKSELVLNLNQKMNEIENREFYYGPLSKIYLKSLPQLKEINDYLTIILNTKNEEEKKKECDKLSNFLKANIVGRQYREISSAFGSLYPFIVFKEIIFVGKDGWTAAAFADKDKLDAIAIIENRHKDSIINLDYKDKQNSHFGSILSSIVRSAYFGKNMNPKNNKEKSEAAKGELLSEKTLELLSSAYGSDVALKITNLPDNLFIVANTYSSIGLFTCCLPNIKNPEYILVALIYFDTDFIPYICNIRNDRLISYKEHLASGSMDDKIFCFYSPNLHIGESFFRDNWYINLREELKTVKELGLAGTWINTSYIPLSKKVDINGIHYLEARQGNHIKDNVYAALGSEFPIKENIKQSLNNFGSIILFSIIMIILISQSIISDLLDPVKKLINGASEVSRGNYKFRTNFIRKDELGTLCFSFDKMMKGLEEKQLMNRMVSKTALKVASDLSEIQSKKVNVALLYITVPDFNTIMHNTPSYELFSKLRKQIASISKIVIDNGGDIDKIMGEKLLIAFRVRDKSPEEVAYNASQVANLINRCEELYFDVAIGVNYGEVISGYVGVGAKRDFTVIGDPVNVAARIAVFAEKLESNRLIVSERIMQLVKGRLETKEFGEVLFKGKTNPSKVYKII